MLRLIVLCLLANACRDPAPAPAPAVSPAPRPADVTPTPEKTEAAKVEVAAGPDASKNDCNVEVYVTDPDPAGLNVRAEPSARSLIVGNIAKDPDGTVLEVTSARNGWLKVRRAIPIDADAYDIDGWVSGQMTQTSLRCPDENPPRSCTVALRAGPSDSEAEVIRLNVDDAVKVIGCRGEWVQAQTRDDLRVRGWLGRSAQCPNPVTSCP